MASTGSPFDRPISRRNLLRGSAGALAGLSFGAWTRRAPGAVRWPSEKLRIAVVGVANRAAANVDGVKGEDIVAVCDIDSNYLARAAEQFPKAAKFADFRKLLDEQRNLDAVVVSTADHTHAPASVSAMRRGLHVYCEKPLSHSVHEARVAAQVAKEQGVATQMGTQIHAGENYRRVVELIRSGAIGPVREAHVWCGKTWSGGERPTDKPEIPAHLSWDTWLGPAPERPYHSTYLPANWRRWWDFGSGTLGDMGCHYMDLPFWALDLKHPTKVSAEGPPVHPETTPTWLKVKYEFPARGEAPPVLFTWTDGSARPDVLSKPGIPQWGDGVLFIGDTGMLLANYDQRILLPEEQFQGFKPPEPTIPNSIGHYAEWIQACKTGSPTTCNFEYSGALTETVHLGNVAYRAGQAIEWDGANLKVTNCPDAQRFVQREYRKGWSL